MDVMGLGDPIIQTLNDAYELQFCSVKMMKRK